MANVNKARKKVSTRDMANRIRKMWVKAERGEFGDEDMKDLLCLLSVYFSRVSWRERKRGDE